MQFKSINPSTEEVIYSFECEQKSSIIEKINSSNLAQKKWEEISFKEKKELLSSLKTILLENIKEFSKIITSEVGKPIKQSVSEIQKCAYLCEYYAKNLESFLKDEIIKCDSKETIAKYEPLGVIFGIMPWNFPFWQVFRFAIPTISAGNSVIIKHAPNTFKCSEVIDLAFKDSGFPDYVYTNIIIDTTQVEEVIKNNYIRGVSFTGSTKVGMEIGALAGSYLKKTVLELGGADPFIVFSDANIDNAVKSAVESRFLNCGQSCISAKRFFIEKSIKKDFLDKLKAQIERYQFGDPMDVKNSGGPIARLDLLNNLKRQIEKAISNGGRILYKNEKLFKKGYYFSPHIIENISRDCAYFEEFFGPVFLIFDFTNTEELIELVNNNQYGLSASIWSENIMKAKEISGQIESGSVFINNMSKSDPRLPFGGIKNSGYGKELSSYGIKEFVNIKPISVY